MLAVAFREAEAPPLIREAEVRDLPALMGMGEKFIAQAWSHAGVPYCPQTAEQLLRALMSGEQGFLLVDQPCTAMVGVAVHPWHFNQSILTATELFWWAETGSMAGRLLLPEAERRAKTMGATTLNMGCLEGGRPEVLGRFYRRQGFRASEHIYLKELN